MNERLYDPIVAEVRQNREKMLAEFNGDTKKLTAYLASKRPEMEAAGLRFETERERKSRLTQTRQRQENIERRLASL